MARELRGNCAPELRRAIARRGARHDRRKRRGQRRVGEDEDAGERGGDDVLAHHDDEAVEQVLAPRALEHLARLRHRRAEEEAAEDDVRAVARQHVPADREPLVRQRLGVLAEEADDGEEDPADEAADHARRQVERAQPHRLAPQQVADHEQAREAHRRGHDDVLQLVAHRLALDVLLEDLEVRLGRVGGGGGRHRCVRGALASSDSGRTLRAARASEIDPGRCKRQPERQH